MTGTDLWRDSGFSVDCAIRNKPIYFFVCWYGRSPVDYVLCCMSDRGFIGWLRGVNDVAERWELARAVHQVMTKDPRFRDIRWYPEGWAAGGDEKWVTEPF